MTDDRITRVRAMTIDHQLPEPIRFGEWTITSREFVLVRVDSAGGGSGYAYCLTRSGPVAQIVNANVAQFYVGADARRPEDPFYRTLWAQHAVHSAGMGMRALSVVDLAAWDLACRLDGQSIAERLGGSLQPMPATAIVGYPPALDADGTYEQVSALVEQGWRRFKVPISGDLDLTRTRLEAVRAASPDGWVGLDVNFAFRTAADVVDYEKTLRGFRLGWIEDVVPPGNAAMVADVRRQSETPVAMGDDQGGSYYPEALLQAEAVDVIRVDATTNGGITRLREIVADATARGVSIAPHMFPHVHARVLGALGHRAPIEWGIPGTGVHPMDDSLEQPTLVDGDMLPLADDEGLGELVDRDWIAAQRVDDPLGVLAE